MFSIHILTKGRLHLELAESAISLRNRAGTPTRDMEVLHRPGRWPRALLAPNTPVAMGIRMGARGRPWVQHI